MPKRPRRTNATSARTGGSFKYRRLNSYRSSTRPGFSKLYGRGPVARTEKKFIDLALTAFNASTTGVVSYISSGISQGASQSQRIGRNIVLKSIEGRGAVEAGTTTTIANVRLMLIEDKQPNKALAGITDILNSASYYSLNNDANKERFRTIMNMPLCIIGNNATPTTELANVPTNFYKKLNIEVTYGIIGDGTIADTTTGALLLVVVSDIAVGTASPNYNTTFRIRYIDP